MGQPLATFRAKQERSSAAACSSSNLEPGKTDLRRGGLIAGSSATPPAPPDPPDPPAALSELPGVRNE